MAIAMADTKGILNPRRGASHFSLTRHAPAPEVAERIDRHWIVRWDLRGRSPFTQDVLPHPCVNLVFQDGEARVFGVVRERFSRRLEGVGMAVGTRFRPGAFAAFVDVPMSRLVGRSVPIAEVFGADGALLEREVARRDDEAEQVAAVERFVAERLPEDDEGFALVGEIVADMLTLPPGARVEGVAARHDLSERTLQRLFRRYIGLGPKWVLQRYRSGWPPARARTSRAWRSSWATSTCPTSRRTSAARWDVRRRRSSRPAARRPSLLRARPSRRCGRGSR
jgi:hypothetical protein